MSNKLFKFLLTSAAVAIIVASVISVIKMTDPVFAAPKGISNLKVFTSDRFSLESEVNDWLAAQTGILVDQIDIADTQGNYIIILGYHTGGIGNPSTRFKFFDGSLTPDRDVEADANAFLSSLSTSKTVRALDGAIGTLGALDIFVIYD